jgi:tetratricopeptide (TPR) repeat protein
MFWALLSRCLFAGVLAPSALLLLCPRALTENSATPAQLAIEQYSLALSNHTADVNNTTSAWRFAEACFDLAEFSTNDAQRASLAREGITAAKSAIASDPSNPAGHHYLALNLGQLARTKLFSALGLVKEMERAFLQSIKLDEKFDRAASHRSLAMLYTDAPGWPASIGSRAKARQHFDKALELAPDYPDNHLSALEAYIQWNDQARIRAGILNYKRVLEPAKEKYNSPKWRPYWRDWDARWKNIQDRAEMILPNSLDKL